MKSKVELLLEKVRRKPSPTCRDGRQLDMDTYLKRRAFADLDEVIAQTLRKGTETQLKGTLSHEKI
jgi:hypothetical protein